MAAKPKKEDDKKKPAKKDENKKLPPWLEKNKKPEDKGKGGKAHPKTCTCPTCKGGKKK